jgi:hypothetical protein
MRRGQAKALLLLQAQLLVLALLGHHPLGH